MLEQKALSHWDQDGPKGEVARCVRNKIWRKGEEDPPYDVGGGDQR